MTNGGVNQNPGEQQQIFNPGGSLQEPAQQEFIFFRDILNRNVGVFVLVNATFQNTKEEFTGFVMEVGTDFVELEAPNLGVRYILPIIFINYIQIPLVQPEGSVLA